MTNQEIEAKAQELYPMPDRSLRKFYSYRAAYKQQEDLRFAVLQGYNLYQPEIDQLKERVKELEEGLEAFIDFPEEDLNGWIESGSPVTITVPIVFISTAKQLLTKNKQQ